MAHSQNRCSDSYDAQPPVVVVHHHHYTVIPMVHSHDAQLFSTQQYQPYLASSIVRHSPAVGMGMSVGVGEQAHFLTNNNNNPVHYFGTGLNRLYNGNLATTFSFDRMAGEKRPFCPTLTHQAKKTEPNGSRTQEEMKKSNVLLDVPPDVLSAAITLPSQEERSMPPQEETEEGKSLKGSKNGKDKDLPYRLRPQGLDIICGRSTRETECHIGNRWFRTLVFQYKEEYQRSLALAQKRRLVKHLLDAIEKKGGTFVEKRILCPDGTSRVCGRLGEDLVEGERIVYFPVQSEAMIEEKARKALRRKRPTVS